MVKSKKNDLPTPDAVELNRIAPLDEAARLAGASEDTLRRHHAHKFIRISPRRIGMRVGDALQIKA